MNPGTPITPTSLVPLTDPYAVVSANSSTQNNGQPERKEKVENLWSPIKQIWNYASSFLPATPQTGKPVKIKKPKPVPRIDFDKANQDTKPAISTRIGMSIASNSTASNLLGIHEYIHLPDEKELEKYRSIIHTLPGIPPLVSILSTGATWLAKFLAEKEPILNNLYQENPAKIKKAFEAIFLIALANLITAAKAKGATNFLGVTHFIANLIEEGYNRQHQDISTAEGHASNEGVPVKDSHPVFNSVFTPFLCCALPNKGADLALILDNKKIQGIVWNLINEEISFASFYYMFMQTQAVDSKQQRELQKTESGKNLCHIIEFLSEAFTNQLQEKCRVPPKRNGIPLSERIAQFVSKILTPIKDATSKNLKGIEAELTSVIDTVSSEAKENKELWSFIQGRIKSILTSAFYHLAKKSDGEGLSPDPLNTCINSLRDILISFYMQNGISNQLRQLSDTINANSKGEAEKKYDNANSVNAVVLFVESDDKSTAEVIYALKEYQKINIDLLRLTDADIYLTDVQRTEEDIKLRKQGQARLDQAVTSFLKLSNAQKQEIFSFFSSDKVLAAAFESHLGAYVLQPLALVLSDKLGLNQDLRFKGLLGKELPSLLFLLFKVIHEAQPTLSSWIDPEPNNINLREGVASLSHGQALLALGDYVTQLIISIIPEQLDKSICDTIAQKALKKITELYPSFTEHLQARKVVGEWVSSTIQSVIEKRKKSLKDIETWSVELSTTIISGLNGSSPEVFANESAEVKKQIEIKLKEVINAWLMRQASFNTANSILPPEHDRKYEQDQKEAPLDKIVGELIDIINTHSPGYKAENNPIEKDAFMVQLKDNLLNAKKDATDPTRLWSFTAFHLNTVILSCLTQLSDPHGAEDEIKLSADAMANNLAKCAAFAKKFAEDLTENERQTLQEFSKLHEAQRENRKKILGRLGDLYYALQPIDNALASENSKLLLQQDATKKIKLEESRTALLKPIEVEKANLKKLDDARDELIAKASPIFEPLADQIHGFIGLTEQDPLKAFNLLDLLNMLNGKLLAKLYELMTRPEKEAPHVFHKLCSLFFHPTLLTPINEAEARRLERHQRLTPAQANFVVTGAEDQAEHAKNLTNEVITPKIIAAVKSYLQKPGVAEHLNHSLRLQLKNSSQDQDALLWLNAVISYCTNEDSNTSEDIETGKTAIWDYARSVLNDSLPTLLTNILQKFENPDSQPKLAHAPKDLITTLMTLIQKNFEQVKDGNVRSQLSERINQAKRIADPIKKQEALNEIYLPFVTELLNIAGNGPIEFTPSHPMHYVPLPLPLKQVIWNQLLPNLMTDLISSAIKTDFYEDLEPLKIKLHNVFIPLDKKDHPGKNHSKYLLELSRMAGLFVQEWLPVFLSKDTELAKSFLAKFLNYTSSQVTNDEINPLDDAITFVEANQQQITNWLINNVQDIGKSREKIVVKFLEYVQEYVERSSLITLGGVACTLEAIEKADPDFLMKLSSVSMQVIAGHVLKVNEVTKSSNQVHPFQVPNDAMFTGMGKTHLHPALYKDLTQPSQGIINYIKECYPLTPTNPQAKKTTFSAKEREAALKWLDGIITKRMDDESNNRVKTEDRHRMRLEKANQIEDKNLHQEAIRKVYLSYVHEVINKLDPATKKMDLFFKPLAAKLLRLAGLNKDNTIGFDLINEQLAPMLVSTLYSQLTSSKTLKGLQVTFASQLQRRVDAFLKPPKNQKDIVLTQPSKKTLKEFTEISGPLLDGLIEWLPKTFFKLLIEQSAHVTKITSEMLGNSAAFQVRQHRLIDLFKKSLALGAASMHAGQFDAHLSFNPSTIIDHKAGEDVLNPSKNFSFIAQTADQQKKAEEWQAIRVSETAKKATKLTRKLFNDAIFASIVAGWNSVMATIDSDIKQLMKKVLSGKSEEYVTALITSLLKSLAFLAALPLGILYYLILRPIQEIHTVIQERNVLLDISHSINENLIMQLIDVAVDTALDAKEKVKETAEWRQGMLSAERKSAAEHGAAPISQHPEKVHPWVELARSILPKEPRRSPKGKTVKAQPAISPIKV